jgi:hypothetical protein
MIEIPVSWGELLDKLTILEIKTERIADDGKRANVSTELALLRSRWRAEHGNGRVFSLRGALKGVNENLWRIEDEIRECERRKDFGPRFIELARSVYITNDERARLKREINALMGSAITEEKSYAQY